MHRLARRSPVTTRVARVGFALIAIASAAAAQEKLFHMEGGAPNDFSGWNYAALGDLDGDGIADFANVDRAFDGVAGVDCGRVVIYSGATRSVLRTFEGEGAGDQFGTEIQNVGDVDGDGFADLGVAALSFPSGARNGKVYVYSSATGALLHSFVGENAGDLLIRLRGIGDATGDGVPDLLLSAPLYNLVNGFGAGKVYVYSGADGALVNTWIGVAGSDFGDRLGRLGFDADGDGLNDFAVGTFEQGMSPAGVGHVYVYSATSQVPLATFSGANPGDLRGNTCDAADLNGDDTPDLLVGSSFENSGHGVVFAYSGKDWSFLRSWSGTPAYGIGASLATLPDLDGDGCAEVGFNFGIYSSPGLPSRGASAILSGRTGRDLIRIYGERAADLFASIPTINAGDLDGDGRDDLLIGSPSYDGSAGVNTGLLEAFRGDDLYLVVDPPVALAGDVVRLNATAGVPGNLGLHAAIAIDGAPLFQPIAPVLAFDANGEIPLSGTVPPGLGAHAITLRAFAIGTNGKLIESSSGTLVLQ